MSFSFLSGGGKTRQARISAITSGKGGVGKTMVASNLAAALSANGERVLILDADLGLANIDVVLNLQPKLTLHDVFLGRCALEDAIVETGGGFFVLLAGSGMVEYSRMTPELRDRLLEVIARVRPHFDSVILDTGAGISEVVLFTVSIADEVVMVATTEPTSMTDAYATVKVLSTLQNRRRFKIVVNQIGRPGDGLQVRKQLQAVVNRFVCPGAREQVILDFLGEIPMDPLVKHAIQSRKLMFEAYPGGPASQAIKSIADRLLNRRESSGP